MKGSFFKNYGWRLLKVLLVGLLAMVIIRLMQLYFDIHVSTDLTSVLRTLGLSLILVESVRAINLAIDKQLGWDTNPVKRFVVQAVMDVGFVLLVFIGIKLVIFATVLHYDLLKEPMFHQELAINIAIVGITLLVVLSDLGIFLVRRWARSMAELERSKKENIQFSYELLLAQINPHFLFNSLNTLCSLIAEDQQKAIGFTRQLSEVFRNVIAFQHQDLITMREELQIARSYIALMQVRFGPALVLDIDQKLDSETRMLPPMSLQLLIENAIKHNIISQTHSLKIYLALNENMLEVRNSLQPKLQMPDASGIGLKNIASRYHLQTGRSIIVDKTDSSFSVKLPLIETS